MNETHVMVGGTRIPVSQDNFDPKFGLPEAINAAITNKTLEAYRIGQNLLISRQVYEEINGKTVPKTNVARPLGTCMLIKPDKEN